MRVFVYEFLTGGGCWQVSATPPPAKLLAEGTAMLQSIVADFAAISDVQVTLQYDTRLPNLAWPAGVSVLPVATREAEELAFAQQVSAADWVLLIAPEFSQHLSRRAQLVEELGGKLLSPSAKFIGVTADKWCTHLLLQKAGVPVPHALLLQRGVSLPSFLVYPVVIKPVDGCGSQGVQLLQSAHSKIDWQELTGPEIIAQEYRPGQAVSIAVLCSKQARTCLPAGRQHLSPDGRFRYLGGELPLSRSQQARAETLALATLAALPPAQGYVGIDLILGDHAEQDCVIEVNPRLTTSYVGLRALSETNLAQAMLAAATNQQPELKFRGNAVHFLANGELDC
jgi:predicted ATP-grasp superfamily ATP-dependent carboligase